MKNWESQIEQDLSWREAELASLKLLLVSTPKNSARHKALLRACCAQLYAHYEGFCKFCWTLMLEAITTHSHLRYELIEPLQKLSLNPAFKKLRGDTSDNNLYNFAHRSFQDLLREIATFPE